MWKGLHRANALRQAVEEQVQKNIQILEEWMDADTTRSLIEEELEDRITDNERDWSKGVTLLIHNHRKRDWITWTVDREGQTCTAYNNSRYEIRYESTDKNPDKMQDLKRLLTPIQYSHPAAPKGSWKISPICTTHHEFVSYIVESLETLREQIRDQSQPIRRHFGRVFSGTIYVGDSSLRSICRRDWDHLDIDFDEAHIEDKEFTMFIVVHAQ